MGYAVLAAEKDARHVGGKDPVPRFEVGIEHRTVVGQRYSGIVEEHVDSSKPTSHLGVEPIDVRRRREVGLYEQIGIGGALDVNSYHRRSLAPKHPDGLGADDTGRPGDNADLAVKPCPCHRFGGLAGHGSWLL